MNKRDILLIENYLNGTLNDDDLKEFEEKKKKDPDFAKEVNYQEKLKTLLYDAEQYKKTKAFVKKTIKKQKYHHRHHIFNIYDYIALAASVVILIGIFIYARQKDKLKNIEKEEIASISYSNKSSSNNEKAFNLKSNEPKVYGKIKQVDRSIKLLSPADNKKVLPNGNILFKWQTSLTGTDTLYVLNKKTNKTVLKKEIKLENRFYNWKYKLPPGQYTWYIGNDKPKNYFLVEQKN
jgi:hypothetical protein